MRKVKDAKDLTTNELIFFKGHAKATYMSDGRNVEEAILQIGTGSGGGKEYVKVTLSNSGALVFMDDVDGNNSPLEPNKVYYVDSFVSEGVSIIDVVPPTGDVGEYTVHFVCNGSPIFMDTFECPANWQLANGQRPTLENGTAYELSVVATKANGTYFYKAVLTAFNRV